MYQQNATDIDLMKIAYNISGRRKLGKVMLFVCLYFLFVLLFSSLPINIVQGITEFKKKFKKRDKNTYRADGGLSAT